MADQISLPPLPAGADFSQVDNGAPPAAESNAPSATAVDPGPDADNPFMQMHAVDPGPDSENPFMQGDIGASGDISHGIQHAPIGIEKQAGQSMQMAGHVAEQVGLTSLGAWLAQKGQGVVNDATSQESLGNEQSYEGQTGGLIRRNAYGTAEGLAQTGLTAGGGAAMGAAIGLAGGPAGALVGAGIGATLGMLAQLPLFVGSAGENTYEGVKAAQLKAGASEADASKTATEAGAASGMAVGGLQYLAQKIGIGKVLDPVLERASGAAAGNLVAGVLDSGFKQAAVSTAKTAGEMAAINTAQTDSSQLINEAGGFGNGPTLSGSVDAAVQGAGMGTVLGAAGAARAVTKTSATAKLLADPAADPTMRANAALGTAAVLQAKDPTLAQDFGTYASAQIAKGLPIEVGPDAMYQGFAQEIRNPQPVQSAPPSITESIGTIMHAGSVDDAIAAAEQSIAGGIKTGLDTARSTLGYAGVSNPEGVEAMPTPDNLAIDQGYYADQANAAQQGMRDQAFDQAQAPAGPAAPDDAFAQRQAALAAQADAERTQAFSQADEAQRAQQVEQAPAVTAAQGFDEPKPASPLSAAMTTELTRLGNRNLNTLTTTQLGALAAHHPDPAVAQQAGDILAGRRNAAIVPTPEPVPAPTTPEFSTERAGQEPGSPTSFTTAKGSTYAVNADGTTTRDKAFRPEHGEQEQGPQPRSEATYYVTPEQADALSLFQTQGGSSGGKTVRALPDGRIGVQYTTGPDAGKFESRTVVRPSEQPGVGLMPVETWQNGARVHFGNAITEVSSGSEGAESAQDRLPGAVTTDAANPDTQAAPAARTLADTAPELQPLKAAMDSDARARGQADASTGFVPVDTASLPDTRTPANNGVEGATTLSKSDAGLLQKTAAIFGKKVVLFRQEGATNGHSLDGAVLPSDANTIYVNADASGAHHLVVVGHELAHQMQTEAPTLYKGMQDALMAHIGEGGENQFYRYYMNRPGMTDEQVRQAVADPGVRQRMTDEFIADLTGNRFGEYRTWQQVFADAAGPGANKSLIYRIADFITSFIDKLTGNGAFRKFATDDMVSNLTAVRTQIRRALSEYATQSGAKAMAHEAEQMKARQANRVAATQPTAHKLVEPVKGEPRADVGREPSKAAPADVADVAERKAEPTQSTSTVRKFSQPVKRFGQHRTLESPERVNVDEQLKESNDDTTQAGGTTEKGATEDAGGTAQGIAAATGRGNERVGAPPIRDVGSEHSRSGQAGSGSPTIREGTALADVRHVTADGQVKAFAGPGTKPEPVNAEPQEPNDEKPATGSASAKSSEVTGRGDQVSALGNGQISASAIRQNRVPLSDGTATTTRPGELQQRGSLSGSADNLGEGNRPPSSFVHPARAATEEVSGESRQAAGDGAGANADLVPARGGFTPEWMDDHSGDTGSLAERAKRVAYASDAERLSSLDQPTPAYEIPEAARGDTVKVYRAVDDDTERASVRPGDAVFLSRAEADKTGGRVVAETVPTGDVLKDATDGSYHYAPQGLAHEGESATDMLNRLGADGFDARNPEPEETGPHAATANPFSSDPAVRASGERAAYLGKLDPAQEAAARAVGGIKTHVSYKDQMAELRKDLGAKLAQGIADQFHPIKKIDMEAYRQTRLSKGAETGGLEALMLYGKPFLRDGVLDVDVHDKGFAKVLSSLDGEHGRFFLWVAAQRAEQLKAQGKENLFTDSDISALKTLDANDAQHPQRAAKFAQALKDYNAINDSVLKVAEQSGLLDSATRQMFKDQPYVPFYRAMDEGDGMKGPMKTSGLVNQYAFKKLKGGTNKLNQDLLTNTLSNWAHLLGAAAKNRAAGLTLDAATKVGAAEKVTAAEAGKGSVKVLVNGKPQFYEVNDPHLLAAVSAMSAQVPSWMRPMAAFKRLLTTGTTLSPGFRIRNLIRDTLTVLASSDIKMAPVGNIVQGFKSMDHHSQTFASMLASGGIIQFGSMLEGNEASRAHRLIQQGVDRSTILNNEGAINAMWAKVKQAADVYHEFGNKTENANRGALYEQLIAKGMSHSEASFQARDLMDFSLQGQYPVVRFLTTSVPFLNARIQGAYKIGRAVAENPARAGTVMGAVALGSLALMLAYKDDPDWKKRPDWDRDNYWWFKVGGTAFRIPKPFEVGAVGTMAERTWERMTDPEMTGSRYAGEIRDVLMSQFNLDPVPQIVRPFLNVYANKDDFSGRQIETEAMQSLQPEDRYTPYTSMTSRFLGSLGLPDPIEFINGRYSKLSPVQIDYLVNGYFGWLGTSTLAAVDAVTRPLSSTGPKPALTEWDYTMGFAESLPSNMSRYSDVMYENLDRINQAYASYRAALNSGQYAKAQDVLNTNRVLGPGNRTLIGEHEMASTTSKIESRLATNERRVLNSPTLSAETKRAMLNRINQQRSALAEHVSDMEIRRQREE